MFNLRFSFSYFHFLFFLNFIFSFNLAQTPDQQKEQRGKEKKENRNNKRRLWLYKPGPTTSCLWQGFCQDNKARIISQSAINSKQVRSCPSVRERVHPEALISHFTSLWNVGFTRHQQAETESTCESPVLFGCTAQTVLWWSSRNNQV